MAYQHKLIRNPVTGQELLFLQTAKDTSGALLEMQTTYHAHSKEPAAHYHPYQSEDFKVLSGELTVRMDGQQLVLKTGDTIHIPVSKVHAMWNDSDEQTVVHWKVEPAMNTEHFLETAYGLAIDGKTNSKGMPNILQIALMANRFSDVFRLSKPPYFVQKIVFLLLTPFSYLLGYKPVYKKYLD